jgi:hypothetical protein
VALGKRPEERVGERVLAQVGEHLILDLKRGVLSCCVLEHGTSTLSFRLTRVDNSLLGESLLDSGLVATSVDELVVDDLDGDVLGVQHRDLVGNAGSVGEGGDVLSGTGEADDHVLGVGTAQLRLALLSNDCEIRIGDLGQHGPDLPRHSGVNTTAETLVGTADDDQGLLALALHGLGLGAVEDGVGGLAVGAGLPHGLLGAGELGGGDDLHRLGDLLDVADRLEAALDFTEGGVAGGIGGDERGGPSTADHSQFLMRGEMQWLSPWCGAARKKLRLRAGRARTGRRRPGQLSEPDAQLETAFWRKIEMSGDGDGRVMVVHCGLAAQELVGLGPH